MAQRRSPGDTLKEAVERTVQAGQVTRGSVDELVQVTRARAQTAVGDIAERAGRVRDALEAGRPATNEDVRELQKELRAIARRLDRIEKRLSGAK